MFGSIFYNFWAALLSFAVYFTAAIQNPYAMPLPTIGTGLIIAVIAFGLMFLVRYFLGFVFYTPEAPVLFQTEELPGAVAQETEKTQAVPQSAMEGEDENTEEMAQVVRTMLQSDEATSR